MLARDSFFLGEKFMLADTLQKNQTLYGLIERLDDDVMTEAEAKELRADIESKVDSYAEVRSMLESEVERIQRIAKEFAQEAKAAEARLKRFNDRVLFLMETNGLEKLPGTKWQLAQRLNPESVVVDGEPTEFDQDLYPELVKIKREWSKTAIKAALSEGVDLSFAKVVRTKRVEFKVRKGV